MKMIWISPAFLKWDICASLRTRVSATVTSRPYAMLDHGEDLLRHHVGELFRVDAILTMKRALDLRLKRLNRLYAFDRLCGKEIPKHLIQKLEYCNIIRPLMVRKLLDLRNVLEHQQKIPPPVDRCEEFLEFVWYFLRSTDWITSASIDRIQYEHPRYKQNYGIECWKSHDWTFRLNAWLPATMVSQSPRRDWLHLAVSEIRTRREMRQAMTKKEVRELPEKRDDRGRDPDDCFVRMLVKMVHESTSYQQLVREYFRAH